MTTTQSGDGAVNITVDSTDATTDGQRNTQMRIQAFIGEVAILKAQIKANTDGYMKLLADHEAEKEAHANTKLRADSLSEVCRRIVIAHDAEKTRANAVTLKLAAHNVLLQRVLDADTNCTGEAYAQLIEDIKAAMEVQSGA